MSDAVVFPIVLIIFLIVFVAFSGISGIIHEKQTLDNVKFMAVEKAMLAGGVTPAIKAEVEAFAANNGLDPARINWGTTMFVDPSNPIQLNEDIKVEVQYARNPFINGVLNFLGIEGLGDIMESSGTAKSQYLLN